MVSFSPCKINIGLNIINKRKDGYHNLETCFYPVYFVHDIIEIVPSKIENDKYYFSGIKISGDINENLCYKTVNLLRKHFVFPKIELYLNKIVPMGAGLGGGSANVATIINLINNQFNLNICDSDKIDFANQLGSDCAFFIQSMPAFGTEKGNVLFPLDVNLSNYYLIIVKPSIYVSTVEAYSLVVPSMPKLKLEELINQPIENWKNTIKNDFEKSVFLKYPEIEDIKNKLYQSGAIYAQMSGSGSAVFGIFKKETGLKLDESYIVHSGILT